ncbi:MAG: acyl-CoA thioesterase [Chloroflexi bacterium]|nr:acyl-CoA thioesterase [Chloroflexota bacterium]
MDMDVYGHINNVEYYSYFDTAVNRFLQDEAGLEPRRDQVVGLVVETSCVFKQSLVFPETVDVGVRVDRIGTTSVTYAIGIFRAGESTPAAYGRFVHVYVERATQRSAPIPAAHRAAMERLRLPDRADSNSP